MGVGPSNQAIIQADEDIRKLEWSDIQERLQFFRKWDIMDSQSAIGMFEGAETVLDKNRKQLSLEETEELLERRTSWAEFFEIMYAVEARRRRKLEDRERNLWHPACKSFAMLYDMEALDAFDEYMKGDTVRPHDEVYHDEGYTDDEKSNDGSDGSDGSGSNEGHRSEDEVPCQNNAKQ